MPVGPPEAGTIPLPPRRAEPTARGLLGAWRRALDPSLNPFLKLELRREARDPQAFPPQRAFWYSLAVAAPLAGVVLLVGGVVAVHAGTGMEWRALRPAALIAVNWSLLLVAVVCARKLPRSRSPGPDYATASRGTLAFLILSRLTAAETTWWAMVRPFGRQVAALTAWAAVALPIASAAGFGLYPVALLVPALLLTVFASGPRQRLPSHSARGAHGTTLGLDPADCAGAIPMGLALVAAAWLVTLFAQTRPNWADVPAFEPIGGGLTIVGWALKAPRPFLGLEVPPLLFWLLGTPLLLRAIGAFWHRQLALHADAEIPDAITPVARAVAAAGLVTLGYAWPASAGPAAGESAVRLAWQAVLVWTVLASCDHMLRGGTPFGPLHLVLGAEHQDPLLRPLNAALVPVLPAGVSALCAVATGLAGRFPWGLLGPVCVAGSILSLFAWGVGLLVRRGDDRVPDQPAVAALAGLLALVVGPPLLQSALPELQVTSVSPAAPLLALLPPANGAPARTLHPGLTAGVYLVLAVAAAALGALVGSRHRPRPLERVPTHAATSVDPSATDALGLPFDNAVLVAEARRSRRVGGTRTGLTVFALVATAPVAWALWGDWGEEARPFLVPAWLPLCSFLGRADPGVQRLVVPCIALLLLGVVIAATGPAWVAGEAVAREREQETFPLLVTTRLTSREVIVGKLGGALLPTGQIVATVAVVTLPLAAASRSPAAIGLVAAGLAWCAATGLHGAATALAASGRRWFAPDGNRTGGLYAWRGLLIQSLVFALLLVIQHHQRLCYFLRVGLPVNVTSYALLVLSMAVMLLASWGACRRATRHLEAARQEEPPADPKCAGRPGGVRRGYQAAAERPAR